jgi:hypothetical protein
MSIIRQPKIERMNSTRSSHKRKQYKEKQPRRFIWKKPLARTSFSESIKREFQSKFAEQMQKNIDEFEKFCADHEHLRKRKIQVYSTAIFGPSPFPDIPIEPPKRLLTSNPKDLPLKFPWNGVFDTSIPTVKRKDPSMFFFFEAIKSSEKH